MANPENEKRLRTRCHIIEHDISIRSSIGDLVKNIEKNIGNIDILINNAGIHLRKIAVETSSDVIKQIIGVEVNNSSISAIVDDVSRITNLLCLLTQHFG